MDWSRSKPSRRGRRRWATVIVAAAVAGVISPGTASAQDPEPSRSDAEHALLERFAPVVMVKQQDGPCDTDGEPFEPAAVEIVLDNPEVFLRQVGNDDPVAIVGPSAADLFDLREGWYLDFPGDALAPGCIFEQDFERFADGRSVIYARVATELGRPGKLAVQYWFFWYHNPAKNDHEGDWEFIQVMFDASTPEEALTSTPVSVGYAQHTGGERSRWDDPKLERDGDRPVVYPARGSHASYFGSALFLGRSGSEGFGCDNTDGPSRRLDPEVVALPEIDEVRADPTGDFAWVSFQGRWGQREAGFFNGPTGPFAKARWETPVTWEEGLRDSSVVIPGGDRSADSVLTAFCGLVEFGSSVLIASLRSPALSVTLLAALVALTWLVATRTTWSPVVTSPIGRRRAFGQILRAAGRVWRDRPAAMFGIGVIYVPVAIASSIIHRLVLAVPFVDDLIGVAGERSGTAVIVALLVGGLGNVLAFTYVSAAVAATLSDGAGRLGTVGVRRLAVAVFRSIAIVGVLLISVVGVPWAIRQLVRYQVVPQVVALEHADGRRALERSSELVRQRWWWTAGIVAIIQVTVGVVGTAGALLVLVLATSIPLWLFTVISSLIYVVLVPVAAAAMSFVYGTLSAESTVDEDEGTDGVDRVVQPVVV